MQLNTGVTCRATRCTDTHTQSISLGLQRWSQLRRLLARRKKSPAGCRSGADQPGHEDEWNREQQLKTGTEIRVAEAREQTQLVCELIVLQADLLLSPGELHTWQVIGCLHVRLHYQRIWQAERLHCVLCVGLHLIQTHETIRHFCRTRADTFYHFITQIFSISSEQLRLMMEVSNFIYWCLAAVITVHPEGNTDL